MLNYFRVPGGAVSQSTDSRHGPAALPRIWPRGIVIFLFLALVSGILTSIPAHAAAPGQTVIYPETRLIDGRVLKPGDLKGKVVLVQFWATWCPTCVGEMPDLERLRTKYHGKGFELLALSLDDSEKTVRSFMKANRYDFPAALATRRDFDAYGPVMATPTFYLVDKRGVLLQRVVGGLDYDKLEKVIQSLL